MKSSKIPTPLPVQIREFKIGYGPVLFYAVILFIASALWKEQSVSIGEQQATDAQEVFAWYSCFSSSAFHADGQEQAVENQAGSEVALAQSCSSSAAN
jgi:hypothetical protein